MIELKVNGKKEEVDVPADTPLLWVVREELGLKGSKFGCGKGLCGACTMHLNGAATRTCVLPVAAAANQEVTTIEGLTQEGMNDVQKAWIKHGVPQCGYCQSGQIMQATSLLKNKPRPTDQDIDDEMSGNICRCGTYNKIKAAIKDAAKGQA